MWQISFNSCVATYLFDAPGLIRLVHRDLKSVEIAAAFGSRLARTIVADELGSIEARLNFFCALDRACFAPHLEGVGISSLYIT